MRTVLEEAGRQRWAIDVARRLTSEDVSERSNDLLIPRGVPEHIRSDNGAEFTATKVREGRERIHVKACYVESFNGKRRDELREREIFDTP